ncbi:lysylphosphatidylglycerol synthase transmembrane domain-containing protein [Anaerotardibacter muris]|uniref:lysylphosphatidylglycerol synthase transmembrane domain-containing protein n=1 Tax=Anaerotardibacter muris TaxID=2941505 RepID=UPI00203EFEEF|nr:lysylphosphatidylglycerol synthase transmembrane domain-containing protein [Anaerotardibacter muris]
MKKAIIILVIIIAAGFIVANFDYLMSIINAMQGGALIPLVVAIIIMVARHVVQAMSYNEAFGAVGHKTGLWHNIVLIFSLVFINTFCLFSGATGVAFIIDDAHRRGCDIGTSTSGAILSQIGYFAAVFLISIIGFTTMLVAGTMNVVFLIGGLLLAGTLLVLLSFFFMGYYKPGWLVKIFRVVENIINKVIGIVKRQLPKNWGKSTAQSFINSALVLAHNPKGALITVFYAAVSALLNMACLIAIGVAFGFEDIPTLVAAFSVAAIAVILSPTPQGVGVVEAAIAAILTSAGCSLSVATAIALVYRGIMFWIPFCIGAILLSQSGFFQSKKDTSLKGKYKDTGWIAGTLVIITAVVNLVMAFLPDVADTYSMLTQWIDIGNVVGGPLLVATGVLLLILGVGLIFRFRIAWAFALTLIVILAGFEFVFHETVKVAIPMTALALWLFFKRDAFSEPFTFDYKKRERALDQSASHGEKKLEEAKDKRDEAVDDLVPESVREGAQETVDEAVKIKTKIDAEINKA